jgi:hypothetical protein
MVFDEMRRRIALTLEGLGTDAGKDPLQDRYHSGYVQAYRDLLEIDFIDEETHVD